MNSPVIYDNSRKNTFNDIYAELLDSIEWVSDMTPRQEAFYSFVYTPYAYGSGELQQAVHEATTLE